MPRAYLGLGGNMGDVKANLQEALQLLEASGKVELVQSSSLYETAPVGFAEQAWFINLTVEIKTSLQPYELLALCNAVELQLKRERLLRWGPRTIDIDILLYEGFTSQDERLTIPHPRMKERAFVIFPLMEIAPELVIENQSIQALAEQLKNQEIRKL